MCQSSLIAKTQISRIGENSSDSVTAQWKAAISKKFCGFDALYDVETCIGYDDHTTKDLVENVVAFVTTGQSLDTDRLAALLVLLWGDEEKELDLALLVVEYMSQFGNHPCLMQYEPTSSQMDHTHLAATHEEFYCVVPRSTASSVLCVSWGWNTLSTMHTTRTHAGWTSDQYPGKTFDKLKDVIDAWSHRVLTLTPHVATPIVNQQLEKDIHKQYGTGDYTPRSRSSFPRN
jgi:hypothetical protein